MRLKLVYEKKLYFYCQEELCFASEHNLGETVELSDVIDKKGTFIFGSEGNTGASFFQNAEAYLRRYFPGVLWIQNPQESYTRWNCRSIISMTKGGTIRFGEYRLFTGTYKGLEEDGFSFHGICGWSREDIFAGSEEMKLDFHGTFHFDAKISGDQEWMEAFGVGIRYTIPWKGEEARWTGWKKELYSPVLACTDETVLNASIAPHRPLDCDRTRFVLPPGDYKSRFLSRMGMPVTVTAGEKELALVLEKRWSDGYYMGLEGCCNVSDREVLLGTCGTEYAEIDGKLYFCSHQNGYVDPKEDTQKEQELTDRTTTAWISFDGIYYSSGADTTFFAWQKKGYMESISIPYARVSETAAPVFCWAECKEDAGVIEDTEKLLYGLRKHSFTEMNQRAADRDEAVLSVTMHGIIAGITEQRKIDWFGLARFGENELPDIRLEKPDMELQRNLLEKESFLVFHNPEELLSHAQPSSPFSMQIDGWRLHMEPDRWRDDTVFILKYSRSRSIREALQEDADFQTAYQGAFDNKGNIKAGYERFVEQMGDPGFTGIVLMNGSVSISELPGSLKFILQGIDPEKIFVPYLTIKRSRIAGDGLWMKRSDLDALILYEDDGKLTSEVVENPSDYSLRTTELFVRLVNSKVREFRSTTEFLINRMLGAKVEGTDQGNGNCLLFDGRMRSEEQDADYQFSLKHPTVYHFNSSSFEKICINDAALETESGKVSLAGSIFFEEWEGCDLLGYGGEAGLGFRYLDFIQNRQGIWYENLDNLFVDNKKAAMRMDSVPGAFGASVKRLLVSEDGKMPEDYGYISIQAPVSQGKPGESWTAVEWEYIFGINGELGDCTVISFRLLSAWSVREGKQQRYVGVSKNLKEGITLEGILGLGFSSVSLIGGDRQFTFLLHQFSLNLLSMSLPVGNADVYLFGENGKTGWYAAYVKEDEDGASVGNLPDRPGIV